MDFEQLLKSIEAAREGFAKLWGELQTTIEKAPKFLDALEQFFDNWPAHIKGHWIAMAEHGWFLNWCTPVFGTFDDPAKIDEFMIEHLDKNWDVLTGKIIELYPKREEVLTAAFKLHQSGNYIACIPLFLSQTDGICAQNLGAYLFSEHEDRLERISNRIDDSNDVLTNAFLETLMTRTQIGEKISKSKAKHKLLGPNRNGILHGSRKHLDYGTRTNSYKAFSYLAFLVYCFMRDDKAEIAA